jgi:hypothetical protein
MVAAMRGASGDTPWARVIRCFFAEALADDAAEVRRIVDAANAVIVRHGRIRAQRTRAIDLAVGGV